MKPLLFAPALLCLVPGVVAIGPEDGLPVSVAHPVIADEGQLREGVLRAGALPVLQRNGAPRLEDVKKHLEALARDLEETQKAIEEVGRQRDAALKEAQAAEAESQRHLRNHQRAMHQLGELQSDLGATRKERASWKEKAEAGALTHEELLAFRGELAGTRKRFDLLLGDLAKARSELQDPIERAGLKKSLEKAEGDGKMLRAEVEEALNAKADTEETAKRTQAELESKLEVLRSKAREGTEWKSALQQRSAELNAEQARMKDLTADYNGLKTEHGKSARELADTMEELRKVRLASRKAESEAAAKIGEAVKRAGQSGEERERVARERDALKLQLAEASRQKKASDDVRQKLKASEEACREASTELEETRQLLAATRKEMTFTKKAKTGLEELLFKKTAELRALRAELRKAQGEGGERAAGAENANLGMNEAPRAVIVAEG